MRNEGQQSEKTNQSKHLLKTVRAHRAESESIIWQSQSVLNKRQSQKKGRGERVKEDSLAFFDIRRRANPKQCFFCRHWMDHCKILDKESRSELFLPAVFTKSEWEKWQVINNVAIENIVLLSNGKEEK